MIPKHWNKFGEVYSNEREECVFVCVVCMEHIGPINLIYTTSDPEAFWSHIQKQHIMEEPPAKRRNSGLISPHCDIVGSGVAKNAANLHAVDTAQDNIQLLEKFHNNLVGNFNNREPTEDNFEANRPHELDVKIETEIQLTELHIKDEPIDDKTNATQSTEQFKNYSYNIEDQGIYTISDDDDEEDEEDENCDTLGPNNVINGSSNRGYLVHNDMIELSDDDDDDENHINTRPNSPHLNGRDNSINTDKPAEVLNNSGTLNVGYTYNCLPCDITFPNRNVLVDHLKTHEIEVNTPTNSNPINCIPTPSVSPNDVMDTNNVNQITQPFQCNFPNCPHRFCEAWQLERHQRLHLSNQESKRKFTSRPFQCNSCGRRTSSEKAMQVHQRRFHSPEYDSDTTPCPMCQKRILNKNLNQHISHIHKKVRFNCGQCERSYAHKKNLTLHMDKCHSNVGPINTNINPIVPNTHPMLTPEEQDFMYSFFLRCQSKAQNNQHANNTSVPSNTMDQTPTS